MRELGGIPVARILGIEVRVQLGWIVPLALVVVFGVEAVAAADPTASEAMAWVVAIAVAAGYFASVLVHDLAHALAGRRRGMEVGTLSVSFFGGPNPGDPSAERAEDELFIALAGPVVSLLIAATTGLLALAVDRAGGAGAVDLATLLAILCLGNGALGLINLVPAYPLDGGRIVRALLWRRTGSEARGALAAATAGRLAGLVVIGGGVLWAIARDLVNGAMVALCGWFLILTARAIRDRVATETLLGGLAVRDAMEPDPAIVAPGLTLDTVADPLLDPASPATALAVVGPDGPVGVLGYRAVHRVGTRARATTRVQDIVAAPPRAPFVGAGDELAGAVARLARSGADGLLVVDGDAVVGLLTRHAVGRVVTERQARVATSPGRLRRGGR